MTFETGDPVQTSGEGATETGIVVRIDDGRVWVETWCNRYRGYPSSDFEPLTDQKAIDDLALLADNEGLFLKGASE